MGAMRLEQEAEVLARPPMAALRQGPIEAGNGSGAGQDGGTDAGTGSGGGSGAAEVRGDGGQDGGAASSDCDGLVPARRARRPSSAGWTATEFDFRRLLRSR